MADKKISDLTAATSLADGDYLEIENAGGNSRKIAATVLKAYGSPWSLVTSWTWSTNVTSVTLTGLGSYSELIMLSDGTTTSSTAFRFFQASTDGGSTFYTTSGDYKNIGSNGALTNAGDFGGQSSTSTTNGSIFVHLMGNVAGLTKIYRNANVGTGYCANAGMVTNAINAVQFSVTAGNITAGTIKILGRV